MKTHTFAVHSQDELSMRVSSWGSIKKYVSTCYEQKRWLQHFIYCVFTTKSGVKNIRPMSYKSHKKIQKKTFILEKSNL